MRRLRPGKIPDPTRAHGAWVFLVCAVLAGAVSAARGGVLPALLAGLSFAGVFFLGSAAAVGLRKGAVRAVIGLVIAVGGPLLALAVGADPGFFGYGLVAVFPAGLAAWVAEKRGFQSPIALSLGVCALVLAAPSAACAGGADMRTSLMLLGLLVPLYVWRTVKIRTLLSSLTGTDRTMLKRVGRREALYALVGTLVAVGIVHLVS